MKKPISCIIIEDELIYQKTLTNFIEEVEILKLKGVYSSPAEAKKNTILDHIDLVFLDIIMPGESGLEFAYSIKNSNCKIIFTTSKSEFAIHAYDLEAIDYLVKPIDFLRFKKAVDKGAQIIRENREVILSKISDIKLENILYFTKEDGKIAIYHKNGVFYLKNSLKGVIQKMDDSRFVRIHKSYGVNVEAVLKVTRDKLFVKDKTLPLSRQGKLELMKQMKIF